MADRPTQTARIIDAALWLNEQNNVTVFTCGHRDGRFAAAVRYPRKHGIPRGPTYYADTWWDAVLSARDAQNETPDASSDEGAV